MLQFISCKAGGIMYFLGDVPYHILTVGSILINDALAAPYTVAKKGVTRSGRSPVITDANFLQAVTLKKVHEGVMSMNAEIWWIPSLVEHTFTASLDGMG